MRRSLPTRLAVMSSAAALAFGLVACEVDPDGDLTDDGLMDDGTLDDGTLDDDDGTDDG